MLGKLTIDRMKKGKKDGKIKKEPQNSKIEKKPAQKWGTRTGKTSPTWVNSLG